MVTVSSVLKNGTYYGVLRCYTIPSRENFRRQWPAPRFLRQTFLSPIQCCTFFEIPYKGHDLLSLWNLIKILTRKICKSIYSIKQTVLDPTSTWTLQNLCRRSHASQLLNWTAMVDNLAWEPCEYLHDYSTGMHSTSFWLAFLANVEQGRALELSILEMYSCCVCWCTCAYVHLDCPLCGFAY